MVVRVVLAFPPDHVTGLAVTFPVCKPSLAPGTVVVVACVVPVPELPALSPFTTTCMSYVIPSSSPVNVYVELEILLAPLGVV